MTYHYKSQAVLRDIVLKSATFAFLAGLVVNVPVSINLIATSMLSGCYDREQYIQSLTLLPIIHIMVFLVVFLLMCSMFTIMLKYNNGNEGKE